LIASGQAGKDGKYAVFRLWDYETARCITFMDVPVHILNCMSFSWDGRYLVTAGVEIFKTEVKNDVKIEHKKEVIIIWDIARVSRGEKPEIVAK
jgi:WD40 repeat protein